MSTGKAKVLIVEDDILLAEHMKMNLSADYAVVGIAATADQAESLLKQHLPDLALLDIALKGSRDGINVAETINKHFGIPFIFLTSHTDEPLVNRAKVVKPHAYLLKPYNEYEVPIAIEMALANFERSTTASSPQQMRPFAETENRVMNLRNCLFLKKDTGFKKVKLEEITFLQADNNYTTIFTAIGDFIYSIVLKKIEEKLPKNVFMRVHRSYVVNIEAVDGFEGNTLFVNNKRVPVSKQYRDEVFGLFRGL